MVIVDREDNMVDTFHYKIEDVILDKEKEVYYYIPSQKNFYRDYRLEVKVQDNEVEKGIICNLDQELFGIAWN